MAAERKRPLAVPHGNATPTAAGAPRKRVTRHRTPPPAQSLTQDVWYRLMKLTNLINRPFFTQDARPHAISINEWRLIMTLASLGEAAAHELAEASGLHPMNVSRSLAVLRRQARITVRVDPANRRRKLFKLSPRGNELYRTLLPGMQQRADDLFSLISPREIDDLGIVIDKLIARLGKSGSE